MHIVVIGAGIVGLTAAWQLQQDGNRVTVIEREPQVGRGASFANGAQLSYSYVAPLASPSVPGSLPKWLLRGDSPVRYSPSADPGEWAWLLKFLSACRAGTSAVNTAKLLALSLHSRDRLHALITDTRIDFDHATNGKLVIQSSPATQADAIAQMRLQAAFGCEQRALTAAECIELEPGLASIEHRLIGGIHTPGEKVGDCRRLCEGLALHITQRGASLLLDTPCSLAVEGRRVAGIDTPSGRVEADLYVLAAGIGSRALGRQAGLRLPVLPIRGYSISAPILAGNRAPVRSVTDTHRKTVYAPLGGRLRVAGFAEIGGHETASLAARAQTLSNGLHALFPAACANTDLQPWSGSRPATPTGVPIIGTSRIDNLMLNVGHGALGFTLAAGSASLLADLVAGRPPSVSAMDYAINT